MIKYVYCTKTLKHEQAKQINDNRMRFKGEYGNYTRSVTRWVAPILGQEHYLKWISAKVKTKHRHYPHEKQCLPQLKTIYWSEIDDCLTLFLQAHYCDTIVVYNFHPDYVWCWIYIHMLACGRTLLSAIFNTKYMYTKEIKAL